MRILYITDLHGSRWKYERLLKTAQAHQADLVINGGDLLPKGGSLANQEQFLRNDLDAHFAAFQQAGIPYSCCLGNDDLRVLDGLFDELCQKYPLVENLAQRRVVTGGYEFIGMNWVVDFPFRLKDRCRVDTAGYVFQDQLGTALLSTPTGYQEIADWQSYAWALPSIEDELERLVKPDDPGRAVYVIHMPPAGLGLDQTGHGLAVGSKAVYRFLERMQPRLALHGHIHEAPETSGKWSGKIGQTVCVQPGQLEPLTYAVIDLETMQLERFA